MKLSVSWLVFGALLLLGTAAAVDENVHAIGHEQVRELLFKKENVDVIVKYKNASGKSKVKQKAKKVKLESVRFKFVAIEVTPQNLQILLNDPDVETIEFDYEMYAVGGKEDASTPKDPGLRMLAESTPYGIVNVQANQIGVGPHASQIKVCVVDTGCK